MNNETAKVLENLIPYLYRLLRSEKAEFCKLFSLTPTQLDVLYTLKDSSKNLSGISDDTLLDSSTLVGIVDRLSKRGLIKKKVSPKDRRKNILTLSEKGEELLNTLPQFNSKTLETAIEALSTKEAETFSKLIEKIILNFQSITSNQSNQSIFDPDMQKQIEENKMMDTNKPDNLNNIKNRMITIF